MRKKRDRSRVVLVIGWVAAAVANGAGSASVGAEEPDASMRDSVLLAETADDLFLDLPTEEESPAEDVEAAGMPDMEEHSADAPGSADELFQSDVPEIAADAAPETPTVADRPAVRFSGFVQNELAYTYADPDHFSKFRTLARLRLNGTLSARVKWQASGTFFYDPVFELEDDFYPDRVEDDQKLDGWIDETFLDIDADDWEFRIGRQHIIWGEMVGLFFADVVSALDLRQFVLPDFDLIRIPQWAARAEYFKGDFHAEFIYLPVVTKDNVGEFGGDYRPNPFVLPAGVNGVFLQDEMLNDAGEDYGAGSRLSYLHDGWDLSAFYYTSPDKTASYRRDLSFAGLVPTVVFKPEHERIHQLGGTLAKDFGQFVLKSEAVQTFDRRLSVTSIADPDGLAETDELRYVVGIDWAGEQGHNVNVQFFQTWFQDQRDDMGVKELETGASVYLTTSAIHPDIEPEILWIRSLDRNDWLLEMKVTWEFAQNWRGVLGADIFEGRRNRLFGQFDDTDRVYYELRYSF
ncbi:MAG: DUF1302 family protein [Gammaproteobacteria bacterium]